jgi:23S rRNA (uracil1939-C5)-methyltransferase
MTTAIVEVTHHGMGRVPDGGLYPRCLPGEVVEPLPDGTVRILTPSPERVAAPCRHFRTCGGCAMQHASDPFVSGWKAGIVTRALLAQGITAPIAGVITSSPRSRRRARLAGRRTKGGALLGFHARASDQIVATPDCLLLKQSLHSLFPALETLVTLAATRTTEVTLTLTDTPNGADILVDGGRPLTANLRRDLAQWVEIAGVARLVWGADLVAQRLPPALPLGRAQVVPPPGAFLQATDQGEAALVSLVRQGVGKAQRLADLFAGCGTFALPLAEQAEVLAVEGEAPMLAALEKGWRGAHGLRRVTTQTRDLFRNPMLPEELAAFDAVVIDPPRAGAEAQCTQIALSRVPVVVMVSCHPASFARDARILGQGGYAPGPITVIDQFRWSPHVELVSVFTKA